MREDNRDRFAEELLDAALANCRGAEPRAGLEERVLANLREQPRAARPISWRLTPILIAMAFVLTFFAMDHLMNHPVAPDSVSVALSGGNESRGAVESNPAAQQVKAEAKENVDPRMKQVKAHVATRLEDSSSRRQDLAINPRARRSGEQTDNDLRVEEVRITEVRLDDIVISNNER